VYTSPLEYFDASTDTMDLPEEWYDAIVYDVAVKLAPRWGISLEDRKLLRAEAHEYLQSALDFGFEDGSLYILPDGRP